MPPTNTGGRGMTDGSGGSPTRSSTVHYEETLDMRDETGAGSLIGWVRILIAFLIVSSLGAVALVVFVGSQGGEFAPVDGFVDGLVTGQSGVVAFVVAGIVFLLVGVAFVWLFVKNVGRAVGKEVHTQVTDDGVSVSRTGSQYWQSSGVDIPFDVITSIEYVDPEASSFRMELRDFRAPKFFAGRSRNWIRLERAHGPAVYIGSDRPQELAAAIAQRVTGNVRVEPF